MNMLAWREAGKGSGPTTISTAFSAGSLTQCLEELHELRPQTATSGLLLSPSRLQLLSTCSLGPAFYLKERRASAAWGITVGSVRQPGKQLKQPRREVSFASQDNLRRVGRSGEQGCHTMVSGSSSTLIMSPECQWAQWTLAPEPSGDRDGSTIFNFPPRSSPGMTAQQLSPHPTSQEVPARQD